MSEKQENRDEESSDDEFVNPPPDVLYGALMTSISECIDRTVSQFIKEVCEEYLIPQTDLKDKWAQICHAKQPETGRVNECTHIYVRGVNSGKKCTTALRGGATLCSKHRKR